MIERDRFHLQRYARSQNGRIGNRIGSPIGRRMEKRAAAVLRDFARRSDRHALRPVGARWKDRGRVRRDACPDRDRIFRTLCFLRRAETGAVIGHRNDEHGVVARRAHFDRLIAVSMSRGVREQARPTLAESGARPPEIMRQIFQRR